MYYSEKLGVIKENVLRRVESQGTFWTRHLYIC